MNDDILEYNFSVKLDYLLAPYQQHIMQQYKNAQILHTLANFSAKIAWNQRTYKSQAGITCTLKLTFSWNSFQKRSVEKYYKITIVQITEIYSHLTKISWK